MLDRALQMRGAEALDLGGVIIEREFNGGLSIIEGGNSYSMDRVPADVFERLTAAIERFNEISSDGGLR